MPLNIFGGRYMDVAIRQGMPVVASRDGVLDDVFVSVCTSLDCSANRNYSIALADPGITGGAGVDVDSLDRIWVAFNDGFFGNVKVVRSD